MSDVKQRHKPRLQRAPLDLSAEASLLRALGDVHRLRILTTLARADEDVCVCELNEHLPLLQPTVSHHLRVLKDAGLITSERCGTWVYHRLAPDARARIEQTLDIVMPERTKA